MAKVDQQKRATLIAKALQIAKSISAPQEQSRGGKTFPANPRYMAPRPKEMMERPLMGKPSWDLLGSQGKAEGGEVSSFRDMLDVNPRGWGMEPPGMDSGSLRATEPPPMSLGEGLGPLGEYAMRNYVLPESARGAGPEGGAGDIAGRELTLENAGQVGLSMLPFEKAGAGLALAGKYARKAWPAGVAALGIGAGATGAGAGGDDVLTGLMSQQAQLNQRRAKLEQEIQGLVSLPKNGPEVKQAQEELVRQGYPIGTKGADGILGGQTAVGISKLIQDRRLELDQLKAELTAVGKRVDIKNQESDPMFKIKVDEEKRASSERAKKEELNKSFAERNPIPTAALTWGAPVLSAALSHWGLGAIANKGNKLVGKFEEAKKVGDTLAMQEALEKAAKYNNPMRIFPKQAASVVLPATLPMDARVYGDVYDKYALPESSSAQQRAQQKLADIPQYIKDSEQALGTGMIMSGLGAKGAAARVPAPRGDVNALLSIYGKQKPGIAGYMPGGMESKGTDELAEILNRGSAASSSVQRPMAGFESLSAARAKSPESLGPEAPPPMLESSTRNQKLLPGASPSSPDLLATSGQTTPGSKAPTAAPASSQPVSSLDSPLEAAEEAGARIVRRHKKQGVNEWLTKDGRTVYRHAPGKPEGGNYASPSLVKRAPKSKAEPGPKQPKADNDEFSTGGGVMSRVLSMARKYASGGAVVGPLTGATDGRADKVKAAVPSGSHVLPADFVSHLGSGNSMRGLEMLRKEFGDVSRSAGGEVPVMLSDGEFVVAPEMVAAYGGGNPDRGHALLDKRILDGRKEHIATLSKLPPPAR